MRSARVSPHGVPAVVAAALAVLAGCRSPDAHRRGADEAAARIIADAQRQALGRTEPFSLERPRDLLRKRLMIEQTLPTSTNSTATPSGEMVTLSLMDALQVGARNSRDYQTRKEAVFESALALDLERDDFRNSYAGLISSLFSGTDSDGSDTRQAEGSASAGLTRRLESGASLSSRIALDVVKLLTGEKMSSVGLLVDASISVPLLRGFGRDVAREPLTQAERGVLYALWGFARFKREYAVGVTQSYYRVLDQMQRISNAEENQKRITAARERAEQQARAGRLPEIQVDQARQDELSARTRVLSTRLGKDRQLDQYKLTLGLPADARVTLDRAELTNLTTTVGQALLTDDEAAPGAAVRAVDEAEAIRAALERRLDLRVTRGRREDAARRVVVARDALRAGLDLTASGGLDEREQSGSADAEDTTALDYSVGLELDLPWERTAERNAYRLSLIALDKAGRDIEEGEDQVKLEVRDAIRALVDAREAYRIQAEAVALAERRVNSTALFLEAGRAEIRDILEAQESLVSAQDALTAALVAYRLAELNLRKDTGTLEIDERGIWRDD